jgi:asparagine N-glycosylation enzyme membrane subunit Stt3
MPANTKYTKILIVGLALLSIYAFGVGLRWTIVERLNDYYGGMIFIRESAFYFYFAKELDEKVSIPEIDFKAQYPDGFDVERDHNFAKGKLTVYMHRLPGLRNIPFEEFARKFDALFFCLGIIPLFFVIRLIAGNNWIALLSAAIYAAAMPALPRSTGAGFDMETFSIPLLITHFCLFLYGIKNSRFLFSLLSGFALGMAIAGWDFCQFYILIFSCFIFLTVFLFHDWHYLLRHFTVALPGIIIAGLISGYLRSHYFLASYGMLLAYPLACAGIISFQKEIKRLYIAPAVVIAFLILAVFSNVLFACRTKVYFQNQASERQAC